MNEEPLTSKQRWFRDFDMGKLKNTNNSAYVDQKMRFLELDLTKDRLKLLKVQREYEKFKFEGLHEQIGVLISLIDGDDKKRRTIIESLAVNPEEMIAWRKNAGRGIPLIQQVYDAAYAIQMSKYPEHAKEFEALQSKEDEGMINEAKKHLGKLTVR